MNLLGKKGKAVGLILAGNIPAVRFIVVAEKGPEYQAISILKIDAVFGEVSPETNDFRYQDEFARIMTLAEFIAENPDGWNRFKDRYSGVAADMEAKAHIDADAMAREAMTKALHKRV